MAEDKKILNNNAENASGSNAGVRHSGGGLYEIRVRGQLNRGWSDWLEGMEVKLLENGETILFGPIVDQAALMGVLIKLSRLNLALLSVNQVNKNNKETK